MRPYRSLLILPGDDPEWIQRGVESEADGLVFDLEDLVLPERKGEGRAIVAETIARLRAAGESRTLLVRVNDYDSGHAGYDLEAVLQVGVDGIMLTKTRNRDDIVRFDALTAEFERRNGIEVGAIKFLVPGETTEALQKCYEIVSHERVFSMIGASTRGDVANALGYDWHADGMETLYYRSRVLLASRAAGIEHPTSGAWETEDDIDGLIADAEAAKRLGYRGYLTLYAEHTKHVNQVFTPSPEEIARYRALIDQFEIAVSEGRSTFTFEGRFTDLAHIKTAQDRLAFAASVGIDVT